MGKKVPLGLPLQIDSQAAEKMAEITQSDVERVRALWLRRVRDRRLKKLLEAKVIKPQ